MNCKQNVLAHQLEPYSGLEVDRDSWLLKDHHVRMRIEIIFDLALLHERCQDIKAHVFEVSGLRPVYSHLDSGDEVSSNSDGFENSFRLLSDRPWFWG